MFLFLDTETTGLPTRRNAPHTDVAVWPRIVTVGWAVYRSRHEALSRNYFVVQPNGFSIPRASTAIHGISHEEATKSGRPLAEVLRSLFAEIQRFSPTQLICHNVAFDRPVVLAECLRAGFPLHPLESLPTYCTKEATTSFCAIPSFGGYKWPTLEELYVKLFGRPLHQSHHAARDVDACAECFFEFTSRGGVTRPTSRPAAPTTAVVGSNAKQAQKLLDRIFAFARGKENFDTDFIDSVQEQLRARGSVSPKQLAALQKISKQWKVP
jgi:DNA polymerase III epsilon subunit-like protein